MEIDFFSAIKLSQAALSRPESASFLCHFRQNVLFTTLLLILLALNPKGVISWF